MHVQIHTFSFDIAYCSVDTPIHINRSHLLASCSASRPVSCVDWAPLRDPMILDPTLGQIRARIYAASSYCCFPDAITSRKPLVYERVEDEEEQGSSRREARGVLQQLCRDTTQDVRPDAPNLFNKLVQSLKKLDATNLIEIQRTANSICPKAQ